MTDSRQFVPELVAVARRNADGRTTLHAPSPGLWRDMPSSGSLVRGGESIGALEILGVLHRLRAPAGAVGLVAADAGGVTRRPVDHGTQLLTLEAVDSQVGGVAAGGSGAGAAAAEGALLYVAPSSGRFYRRPSPDKPAFVEVGQVLTRGQTIGVLEVMKTFTRITYDDARLPSPAKVMEILAGDQADLGSGEPILRVEPASE
ncbi:MAG: hypothetical protein KC457_25820 [Myxococcales bacterium]|nr:hypothetical protein [Myxococcales bacterium]